MAQNHNRVFQWVTWITALGALGCMLLPGYLPPVIFPIILFSAALILLIDLAVSWKNLNRTQKWSIGLSIIIWTVLGSFGLGFNSPFRP